MEGHDGGFVSVLELVEERGLTQISDPDAVAAIVDKTLAANPDQLAQFRAGKDKLKGFFVGRGAAPRAGGARTRRSSNRDPDEEARGRVVTSRRE